MWSMFSTRPSKVRARDLKVGQWFSVSPTVALNEQDTHTLRSDRFIGPRQVSGFGFHCTFLAFLLTAFECSNILVGGVLLPLTVLFLAECYRLLGS